MRTLSNLKRKFPLFFVLLFPDLENQGGRKPVSKAVNCGLPVPQACGEDQRHSACEGTGCPDMSQGCENSTQTSIVRLRLLHSFFSSIPDLFV